MSLKPVIPCHYFKDKKIIISRTDEYFLKVYIEAYNPGSGRGCLSRKKNNPHTSFGGGPQIIKVPANITLFIRIV